VVLGEAVTVMTAVAFGAEVESVMVRGENDSWRPGPGPTA